MSMIGAVQAYLKQYSELPAGAPVWVDTVGPAAGEYGVIALAGTRVVETYINGKSLREFSFAFQSTESTADDLARLETNGFYEAFADWLDAQTEAGSLPVLDAKRTAVAIEATGWAFLYEQGNSDTGIYQIQCKLFYEQVP